MQHKAIVFRLSQSRHMACVLVSLIITWNEAGKVIAAASAAAAVAAAANDIRPTACPPDCQCWQHASGQSLYVDCSSKNLISVPQGLAANTVELNLDDNVIASFRTNDLIGCPQLRVLRISRNVISKIESDALSTLIYLEELYLNDNKLNLNDTKSTGGFSELVNLRILNIHNNLAFNDNILRNLINLNTLTIDRLKDVKFGPEFFSLTHLKSLSIYGTMELLRNETFENLWNCSLLELSIKTRNTLSALQPLTFAPLSQLEKLDLSYNRGLGFENVAKAWYGLQYTNISTLILTRIITDTDVAPTITTNFYKDLNLSKITTFSVNRNNIVAIESGMAGALPFVRHIDFSYNRLSNIGQLVYEVNLMKKLQAIDFSYQSKRYLNKRNANLDEENGEKKENLISNSSVKSESDGLSSENKTTPCDLAVWKPCKFTSDFKPSENLKDTPLPDFGPWCILLPSHLESVNLSASLNVQLVQFPQVILFGSYRHLKHVIYRANGFLQFVGPFVVSNCDPMLPLIFDVSDNGMQCIAPDFMKIMIKSGCNVGALVFANNDLGGQLESDVNGRVFRLYRNLTELNLAKNSIKSLPFRIFENLQVLEYLNLSGNSLRKIDFQFTHFEQINVIDISNNLITSLSSDILNDFHKLFVRSNMTLDLSANPIQCACETLSFLRWMENNRRNLINFSKISCLVNDKLVTFNNLRDVILAKLDFECSSNLILKISAGLLGLGLLTVALSIFLYRHRWDIRYYFLNLTARRHRYQLLSEAMIGYEFDAFVSYDHRDIRWVRSELITYIETPMNEGESMSSSDEINVLNVHPLKLCIHGRDFVPGATIEENILTAIKASRKVILVVTENFLQSKWCKFELEIARMESIDRGRNIIIPIMLTSVNMGDMPSILQSLVRKRTYMEWEQSSSEHIVFWSSLQRALLECGLEPCVCECGRTVLNRDGSGASSAMSSF